MPSLITWIRLCTLLILGAAAVSDVRSRRVSRRPWYVLLPLAIILLVITLLTAPTPAAQTRLLLIIAVSAGFGLVLALPMALSPRLGTADAFAILTIALLFPTVPHVQLAGLHLPLTPSPPLFFLSILSDTLLGVLIYPAWLAIRNLTRGRLSPRFFTGQAIHWTNVLGESGTLFTPSDGLRATGLDLDALRKYLQWRDTTLAALRDAPAVARAAPVTTPLPEEIGDGSPAHTSDLTGTPQRTSKTNIQSDGGTRDRQPRDDPWAADAFITTTDVTLYGTTPDQLRTALDQLTDPDTDVVWVSPGIPVLLPLVTGLLLAIVGGDLLITIVHTVFPM